MKIKYLSVSRTQVWEQCKQRYKYKYHLEIPSLVQEPPYLTYGKVVHKIIELYTKNKGEKNINEIKKEVMHGLVPLDEHVEPKDLNPILPNSYKKRFKSELGYFLRLTDKIGFDGVVEWEFKIDLDPPNGKCIRGYIDRLIQKNNKFIILDFKTTQQGSTWRKTSKTITTDLQLQCYTRAVMDYFDADPKNIKAALYYLGGGDMVGASFSMQTLKSIEEKLIGLYEEIENYNPNKARGTIGNHCTRCEYAKICPFFQAKQGLRI